VRESLTNGLLKGFAFRDARGETVGELRAVGAEINGLSAALFL
jgi:hypothetical protein